MELLDALAQLPPVSLAEVQSSAALLTRQDRKYLVPERTAAELVLATASEAQVLTIAGRLAGAYESVYFDTPRLESYYGAAHSRRRRFKVRTRTYVEDGLSFLELKTMGGRGETVKDRIVHLGDDQELGAQDRDFLARRLDGSLIDGLAPVLRTSYTRATVLQGRVDAGAARLTIDADLVCRRIGGPGTTAVRSTIVETKSAGPPTPVDRWLWAHGIRPRTVSKFGVGLASCETRLPANKWHRTLQQHFAHGRSAA
ncbi:MAG: VTC domain-containing protein [Cellulomonadaceae bacterium]